MPSMVHAFRIEKILAAEGTPSVARPVRNGPLSDDSAWTCGARRDSGRGAERRPSASLCVGLPVDTRNTPERRSAHKHSDDTTEFHQHLTCTTRKVTDPNGLSCEEWHPNGLSCAGRGRNDSRAVRDHNGSTCAARNRCAWRCEVHRIELQQTQPNPSNPYLQRAHKKFCET